MRRTFSILTALLPCASCASARTPASIGRASNSIEVSSGAPARSVFTSRLAPPVAATAGTGDGGGTVSKAWGTGRIVVGNDDAFEYVITIYNPNGETFTSAHLHRTAETDEALAIATLFSDVSLHDRYIQLRGTVSVNRATKSGLLAEEMRERPGLFSISVHSTDDPHGAIRGTIE